TSTNASKTREADCEHIDPHAQFAKQVVEARLGRVRLLDPEVDRPYQVADGKEVLAPPFRLALSTFTLSSFAFSSFAFLSFAFSSFSFSSFAFSSFAFSSFAFSSFAFSSFAFSSFALSPFALAFHVFASSRQLRI